MEYVLGGGGSMLAATCRRRRRSVCLIILPPGLGARNLLIFRVVASGVRGQEVGPVPLVMLKYGDFD